MQKLDSPPPSAENVDQDLKRVLSDCSDLTGQVGLLYTGDTEGKIVHNLLSVLTFLTRAWEDQSKEDALVFFEQYRKSLAEELDPSADYLTRKQIKFNFKRNRPKGGITKAHMDSAVDVAVRLEAQETDTVRSGFGDDDEECMNYAFVELWRIFDLVNQYLGGPLVVLTEPERDALIMNFVHACGVTTRSIGFIKEQLWKILEPYVVVDGNTVDVREGVATVSQGNTDDVNRLLNRKT